jgi:hypothetical protein
MTDNDRFVVRIGPGSAPGQYTVQAEGATGEGHGVFGAELPRLAELATQLAYRPREVPQAALDLAKEVGTGLFRAVFDGDIQSIYYEALGSVGHDRRLRIILKLTAVPELMSLPWELLNDGTDYLALTAAVVRYLDVPQRARPFQVSEKVRVLAVGSSGPHQYAALDVAGESAGINDAIRAVEERRLVDVVWARPTLADLNEKLIQDKFNILHFVGHGDRDERSDESALVFEATNGERDLVTGSDLGILLRGHRSLQLVVLNACEGGRADPRDPFKGVASALVKSGISAVVAMQGAISDAAASRFAGTFYKTLIGNARPVDDALLSARLALYAQDRKRLEWATPVLFSRTYDGRIFEFRGERFPSLESTPRDQLAPLGADAPRTPPSPSVESAAAGQPADAERPSPEVSSFDDILDASGAPPEEAALAAGKSAQAVKADTPPAAGSFYRSNFKGPAAFVNMPPPPGAGTPAQPAAGSPSPPAFQQPAAPLTLPQILIGNWVVELRAPQYGIMTMMLTLIALPSGQLQFEGHVWGAPVMVRGQWWVVANQLALSGVRIVGGSFSQQYPYEVVIAFGSWNYQQLAGITSASENVLWNRQSQ